MKNKESILVNIDGANGVGKSTLVDGLKAHYEAQGLKVYFIHFPRYETETGKLLKKSLSKEIEMNPFSQQMIMSADRLDWDNFVYSKIKEEYDIIIVDRYYTSALVYGNFDGIPYEDILHYDKYTAKPDANIILLGHTETLIKRLTSRDRELRKYETEEILNKAHDLYKNLNEIIDNVEYICTTNFEDEEINQFTTLSKTISILDKIIDRRNAND
jgi:dTMP kinase